MTNEARVWVWWNTGTTRRGSWSPVHLAEAPGAPRTLCGAKLVIGRSQHHRATQREAPRPDEVACRRCLQSAASPDDRRAARLAVGKAHLDAAVRELDLAMAAFRKLGKVGENHLLFAQRAWSALVTTAPEDYADEQARRERDE